MTEWISVKTQLPDQKKQSEVIFYAAPYEFRTGMYTPGGLLNRETGVFEYHQWWGDDCYYETEDVTHWMPLPDTAVEEKEVTA